MPKFCTNNDINYRSAERIKVERLRKLKQQQEACTSTERARKLGAEIRQIEKDLGIKRVPDKEEIQERLKLIKRRFK